MMVQSYLDNRNKYQDYDSLSHQSVVVAVTLPTIKMAHMSGTSDPSEAEASKAKQERPDWQDMKTSY
jgi:hypothetical protein